LALVVLLEAVTEVDGVAKTLEVSKRRINSPIFGAIAVNTAFSLKILLRSGVAQA
jgi:hypothetical protein